MSSVAANGEDSQAQAVNPTTTPGEQTKKAPKEKKQRRKKKKKDNLQFLDVEEFADNEDEVEIEYVPETINATHAGFADFANVFLKFLTAGKAAAPSAPAVQEMAEKAAKLKEEEDDFEEKEEDGEKNAKLSQNKLRRLHRLTVAELKQVVEHPEVVELHDPNSAEPKLLVWLKSYRNTVPVPQHWSQKRKYLQGKRGIEKPPFDLPDFIKKTGIMEMREALAEKEDRQNLKARMREKMRPKMGKLEIDYAKLHDAFFRWQTKPIMKGHGDLYYEGKEFETNMRSKKPGQLSDPLKLVLGMPVGTGAEQVPPPWLIYMQRYGPPPSYPKLKIPGLNAPIPFGAKFGYQPGGWGKPPVDEYGRPLYGDVFANSMPDPNLDPFAEAIDTKLWGQLESASDSSEDEPEDEEAEANSEDGEETGDGTETPATTGAETPLTGISSVQGMETPDALELRKKKNIEAQMDNTETQALYRVIPQKEVNVGSGLLGTSHTYDLSTIKAAGTQLISGVDMAVEDPEELEELSQEELEKRFSDAQRAVNKEDHSDLVAEHQAKQKRKKAPVATGKDDKSGAKRFKF